MSPARLIRLFLLVCCVGIVAWSFVDVGIRAWQRHTDNQQRPITLTILHWGGPAENRIVQSLVDEYMRTHPNVQIKRIHSSDFRPKLKTMMAAGTPPDLFYLPPDLLPELAQLKLIRPIDDYLATQDKSWLDDFYPILIDAFTYDTESQRIGKGKRYGLPKDFTTAVFYINVNLFDKASIDWRAIQQSGWTWDEFEAAMKKITALGELPEFKDRKIYGGLLNIWPDTLRNILWTFGGDFFGKDFRDVKLDSPEAQQALELIVRLRLKDQTVFNATGIAKDGGQEFLNGNIGCSGPIGRWETPTNKDIKKFKWDVVPVPYKKERASQIYLTAWTISTASKHPDESFELMKFLCGREGQIMNSEQGLALPALRSLARDKAFLSPDGLPPHRAEVFLDAIPYAKLQQIPREAEWTRIVDDLSKRCIQTGQVTPAQSAQEIRRAWLAELDSPLRRNQWSPMRWDVVMSVTLTGVLTLLLVLWWRARKEKLGPIDRATERAGFIFISPWLIGFLCLTLGPMVVSLLLSFTRWAAMTPVSAAESVGVANYTQLFTNDPTFLQSLKVTAYFVVLGVPVSQIAALAVAMLMNSKVRGITVFRTIYFVPSVVSGVAMAVLWLQIFNNDYGLLNSILRPLLAPFGAHPPNWFGVDVSDPNHPVNDAAKWAIPAFVLMGLWGVGGGMIIYLAGLKGIPSSLYEAATIDGAGPARRFWNVTLPMLSPLIFYNLVMGIIGSFQVFTQAYVMTGNGPDNATLFYVLNLYRQAFEFHNMGYASAMAWVLFLIVLVLTIVVFKGSKSLVYYEGLKT